MALWALGMGLGTEAQWQSSQAAVVGRRGSAQLEVLARAS